jgi:hypothetical protein
MRNCKVSRKVSLILILFVAIGYAQPQKAAESSALGSRADALRERIVAQERAGLDALKTGDLTEFGASTADDAIFVDAHGPATKADVMEHTAELA